MNRKLLLMVKREDRDEFTKLYESFTEQELDKMIREIGCNDKEGMRADVFFEILLEKMREARKRNSPV